MKDILISILLTIALSVVVSICYGTEEPPKRKQGNVQVPTLIPISEESTDIKLGDEPEEIILSPQTSTR